MYPVFKAIKSSQQPTTPHHMTEEDAEDEDSDMIPLLGYHHKTPGRLRSGKESTKIWLASS